MLESGIKSDIGGIVDIMELSMNDIKNLLHKCSYLYGFTLSSNMNVKLGTKRFFEDTPENHKFDKSAFRSVNDFFEKSKITQGKEIHDFYKKGFIDADLEDDTKLIAGLGKNNFHIKDKKPNVYLEICFPKATVSLSEIRSVVSNDAQNFFQVDEMITQEKLKKFFDTFGAIIPERISIGGKFYVTHEPVAQNDDMTQVQTLEDDLTKGLHEKIFKGKQGNSFCKLIDEYMLKCVGGDITLKNHPNLWMNTLQRDFKSWEIISIDSWSWSFDDSLRGQMKELLYVSPEKEENAGYSGSAMYPKDKYDRNNKEEGKGKYVYANGAIYEGVWKDGKPEGKGKCVYANGAIYEGDWKDGKPEGKGKYIFTNGDTYEGDWKDDKPEGKGKDVYADGVIYEGDYKNGKKEGKGKFIDANGDIYEGDWKNGKPEGKGKCIYANGAI